MTSSAGCSEQFAFESEFWPGEGIPVFKIRTARLPLFSEPRRDATVVGDLRQQAGSVLRYGLFCFRTLKPGLVVVMENTVLEGRNLGTLRYLSNEAYYERYARPWRKGFKQGQEIIYLQYLAEGAGLILCDGDVVALACCPWLDRDNAGFSLTTPPECEQWVQAMDEDGNALGWVPVNKQLLVETERKF